jgi:hypothetical protein
MRRERRLRMKRVTTTTHISTAFLLGALTLVPSAGFAAARRPSSAPAPVTHASRHATAMHATRGVVKSIDDTTLVVTRTGGRHAEMVFALNSSTQRTGAIAAGTAVTIRYRDEGKTRVATAILAEAAKPQAAHTKPPKR